MKKLKKLENHKTINTNKILGGGRGAGYWDCVKVVDGALHQDHTCPNGRTLIGKAI